MRNASRQLLIAITTMAAMTCISPSAFGQIEEAHETLELKDESGTDQHCPALTKPSSHRVQGGCLMHASSEGYVELRKHVFGIESHITKCENEFWGRLNEDMEGSVIHQSLFMTPCSRQPCKEAGETVATPWPMHSDEWPEEAAQPAEPRDDDEVLETVFCVEPVGGGTDESCEIEIPFSEKDGSPDHNYEFGHQTEIPGHGMSGFRCELIGHWHAESGGVDPEGNREQDVEVVHISVLETENP